MPGRPKAMLKQINEFKEAFASLFDRLDELCPESFKMPPPHKWNPLKEDFVTWNARHCKDYERNITWHLWYDTHDAAWELFMALIDLTSELAERAGSNVADGEESPAQPALESVDVGSSI